MVETSSRLWYNISRIIKIHLTNGSRPTKKEYVMKKSVLRILALVFVLSLSVALASCDMLPAEITALLGGSKECQHTNVEWVVDKGATCRAEGSQHSVCLDCNETVESNVVIPLAEHKLGDWEIEEESTCVKAGSRFKKCTSCKRKVEVEELPLSTTHAYVCGSCTVCSAVQPASTGLTFTYADIGVAIVSGIGTCTDKSLVIPETAPNGAPVRAIAASAFKNSAITSVLIPDCVTSVADTAFEGCAITKASAPAPAVAAVRCVTLTHLTVTGTGAIPGSAMTSATALASVVICEGVTEIGESAFKGSKKLSSVILPDSLITIGYMAFSTCNALKTITLGPNVVTIGDRAFYNSLYLRSVNIPASVKYIGIGAFSCPAGSDSGSANKSSLVNVEFEVTEGWYAAAKATNTAGDFIDSALLEDNSSAATAISLTYRGYYIKHD